MSHQYSRQSSVLQPWRGCFPLLIGVVRRTSCDGSGTGHGHIVEAALLKLKKSGQFSDESVRIKGTQIHYVNVQTY
jgi:hypothetical protein